LPQPLEARHDILEDLPGTERLPATRIGDRVVQMEDVDLVAAQRSQAAFDQRRCHGIGYTAELGAQQPDLCTDDHGGFEIA
jgi:hypothetical protein